MRARDIGFAFCAGFLLIWGAMSFAHAGESHCHPLAKVKADFKEGTEFLSLTPGQLNFARGAYVAMPFADGSMSDRLPDGDKALLATNKSDGRVGVILWVRGPLVCDVTPVGETFLKAIRHIKTGPLDQDGDEI